MRAARWLLGLLGLTGIVLSVVALDAPTALRVAWSSFGFAIAALGVLLPALGGTFKIGPQGFEGQLEPEALRRAVDEAASVVSDDPAEQERFAEAVLDALRALGIPRIHVGDVPPANPAPGDLWIDTEGSTDDV